MAKMKGSSMTTNKTVEEIKQLPREELLDLLFAYDEYVYEIIVENESTPVGLCEFYEYDYKDYVKGK